MGWNAQTSSSIGGGHNGWNNFDFQSKENNKGFGGGVIYGSFNKTRRSDDTVDFGDPAGGAAGGAHANPAFLNRQFEVNQAARDAQSAIDNATAAATNRAAEMGLDYNPDQRALNQAAASKAASMTNAGMGVDKANVGIANQFALKNAGFALQQQQLNQQQQNFLANLNFKQSVQDSNDMRYQQSRSDAMSQAKAQADYMKNWYAARGENIYGVEGSGGVKNHTGFGSPGDAWSSGYTGNNAWKYWRNRR